MIRSFQFLFISIKIYLFWTLISGVRLDGLFFIISIRKSYITFLWSALNLVLFLYFWWLLSLMYLFIIYSNIHIKIMRYFIINIWTWIFLSYYFYIFAYWTYSYFSVQTPSWYIFVYKVYVKFISIITVLYRTLFNSTVNVGVFSVTLILRFYYTIFTMFS